MSLAAISFSASAVSSACARLSSAQGPAISANGRALPNFALPAETTALGAGFMASFMAGPWDPEARASTGVARALMGKRAIDISGAHRPLVAERHQNEQRLFERARALIAEGEERRRGRIEHDEIGLAARLKRADALVEIERSRPPRVAR